MTLIKTDGLQLAGTMGGTVFKRDRSGLHAIAYRSKVQRDPTAAQSTRRKAYLTICNYIRKHTDDDFIDRWQTYASQHPTKNRLGETIILTWYSAFLSYNLNAVTAGEGVTPFPGVVCYHVIGDPGPDCTGNYNFIGYLNGKPLFEHPSTNYRLGYTPSWDIYIILGTGGFPVQLWTGPTPEPPGVYIPYSSVSGNPEVIPGWL